MVTVRFDLKHGRIQKFEASKASFDGSSVRPHHAKAIRAGTSKVTRVPASEPCPLLFSLLAWCVRQRCKKGGVKVVYPRRAHVQLSRVYTVLFIALRNLAQIVPVSFLDLIWCRAVTATVAVATMSAADQRQKKTARRGYRNTGGLSLCRKAHAQGSVVRRCCCCSIRWSRDCCCCTSYRSSATTEDITCPSRDYIAKTTINPCHAENLRRSAPFASCGSRFPSENQRGEPWLSAGRQLWVSHHALEHSSLVTPLSLHVTPLRLILAFRVGSLMNLLISILVIPIFL